LHKNAKKLKINAFFVQILPFINLLEKGRFFVVVFCNNTKKGENRRFLRVKTIFTTDFIKEYNYA
jgi:hypothetical protein